MSWLQIHVMLLYTEKKRPIVEICAIDRVLFNYAAVVDASNDV